MAKDKETIIIEQNGEEFTKIGHLVDLKDGNKNRDKKNYRNSKIKAILIIFM